MADNFIEIKLDPSIDEVSKKLRSLGPELRKKILDKAVRTAVRKWVDDARAAAPVGTKKHKVKIKGQRTEVLPGNLKKNIAVKKLRSEKFSLSTESRYGLIVRSVAFYWRWQELGKQGFSAKEFIKPAFDANVNRSFQVVADSASKFIAKHLSKKK